MYYVSGFMKRGNCFKVCYVALVEENLTYMVYIHSKMILSLKLVKKDILGPGYACSKL